MTSGPIGKAPPLWLLVAMTGIGPFSMQILIPSLPLMAADLGVSYVSAQLTFTFFLLGTAMGQLLHGPVADRFGRRPVMLWALALYILASALSAFAPGIAWLTVGRIAQAVGACAGMVLARAIIRDVWPREQAASRLGYVVMAMTLAPMLAPTVGAVIEEAFGWRGTMVACLAFGIPLFLATRWRLTETLREPQPLPGLWGLGQAYLAMLRLPAFRWIAITASTGSGVFFAFLAGAPMVASSLGHTPRDYALAFILISICFATGSWMAGRFSARLGVDRMLRLGLWLVTLGALTMLAVQLLLPHTLIRFFLPMGLIALGNGISTPNAVAAAVSVRPERAGTASGMLGAMQMGVGGLLTLMVGALEGGGGIATAAVMAGCGVLALATLSRARRFL